MTIQRDARVVSVRSEVFRLTPKEFDLLLHLAEHAGVAIDRERLLREVWGYLHPGYARTVDSHVTRIRKKLSAAGVVRDPITTVHGVGYRWEASE